MEVFEVVVAQLVGANWRLIASLAFGAVVLMIMVVAIIAPLFAPNLPSAAAIAPGAIVGPPEARRRRLLALRTEGAIGDTAFQRVEEGVDRAELDWNQLTGAR
jgi:hypothetical protein